MKINYSRANLHLLEMVCFVFAMFIAFGVSLGTCQTVASEERTRAVPYNGEDRITLSLTNAPVSMNFHISRGELFEVITNKAETFYFCLGNVPYVSKPSSLWHVYLSPSPGALLALDSRFYIGDFSSPVNVTSYFKSTRIAYAIHRSLLQEVIASGGEIVITFIPANRSFVSQNQETIDISKVGFEKQPFFSKR
jgi:hypothetical protein